MSRRIIVSNRLPFTLSKKEGDYAFEPSSGGLVTALGSFLDRESQEKQMEWVWVGWPGTTVPAKRQESIRQIALEQHGCWPIYLTPEEVDLFYHGFCNKTLWPLFHYFTSYATYEAPLWDAYVKVNERFAEELSGLLQEGDTVWVHDYQLMLLPEMLRKMRPDLIIGFFLHIPFPSFEVLRLLPTRWRQALLEGVLGSDLIGFHTHDYTQYFLRSVYRTLGHDHHLGKIRVGNRTIKVDTFPIGIDAARFGDAAAGEVVQGLAREIRTDLGPPIRILFSVDRLDYSKGILQRLLGFEEFLERYPEWRGRVIFLLSVVPSREEVTQYRRMKKDLDEVVGRINGRHGNTGWMPILYQYRSMGFEELVACYSVADVALITPLRDGMNLVAKEYVACRHEDDGVLILSETAGAARDLGEAILVNPNHKEEIAEALAEALAMDPAEQRRRMRPMRLRLQRYDAAWWARSFMESLDSIPTLTRERRHAGTLTGAVRSDLTQRFAAAEKRLLLLDYDGTLVPFARLPELAVPDGALKDLLKRLCEDPRNTVAIISGRDRGALEGWFGEENIHLVAEHGAWIRSADGEEWKLLKPVSAEWKDTLRPLMDMYVGRLPGSLLEEKDFSLAWHYRGSDPELGMERAKELVDDLIQYTANFDVQVIEGNRVVEVRIAGVHKGAAALHLASENSFDAIFAVGDDPTDEDIFEALPREALTVHVGNEFSRARFRLRDYIDVRELLEEMAQKA